jgi:hypothetical protein
MLLHAVLRSTDWGSAVCLAVHVTNDIAFGESAMLRIALPYTQLQAVMHGGNCCH